MRKRQPVEISVATYLSAPGPAFLEIAQGDRYNLADRDFFSIRASGTDLQATIQIYYPDSARDYAGRLRIAADLLDRWAEQKDSEAELADIEEVPA